MNIICFTTGKRNKLDDEHRIIHLILLSLPFIFGWGVVFSWKDDGTAKLEEAEGKIP